jgi:hypothetical protein
MTKDFSIARPSGVVEGAQTKTPGRHQIRGRIRFECVVSFSIAKAL